ncbi:hypothetical protein GCK72_012011 [Caenorhabditis remanei]|uniref:Uncharacterized protein n=1 Tax=Caenorhabditis remanei TaxID=31234 RepID=A0A6A5GLR5_CAERE|nr:hypothetical protein GCK72_012011 [Caenorhabditis remanei]KAF1755561.1 hypothetical protein GCK72_012011 [Caenorhabditis remanei]
MYQLKWSRQLEQVAFEYLKESKKSSNPMASIEYKDHIGFYWLGNVFNILSDVVGFAVPEGKLKEKFKDFLEVVEAIVMFIWLALAAPKSIPIKEGAMFGPAEAILPYRESMFKSGIPCTSCPTHCEYWQESDGTITEGELCVPPKEEQVNFVASNMTLTDTVATDSITFALMIPFILILAFHSWK